MADFTHTRKWWPSFLLDEVMPEGRESPEKWLAPDNDGVTTVHWDDEKTSVAGTISPGETVKFNWREDRGSVEITVMPDGTWSLDDPRDTGTVDMFTGKAATAAPTSRIEDANWFAESGDYDTMSDSMDSFAANWADMETIALEGERLTVDMGYWHDGVTFTVSADGLSLTWIEADHG